MRLRYYILIFLLYTIGIKSSEFRLGVENISDEEVQALKNKNIGLITNRSGIDQKGRRTLDILLDKKLNVTHVFAPEHGFDGTKDSGQEVKDTQDKASTIPIISIYGNGTGKSFNAEIMKTIDALIFDIQDSGMRHYTYISTLLKSMEIAKDKLFIVLDRPNPLGLIMEGPLVDAKFISFISIAPIPVRHGMTIGELADYFNRYQLKEKINLKVVKMKGFSRLKGLPKVKIPLSPGIRSIQSCYGYSFIGLLGEVGPLGIGLRTENPFQCITLPKEKTLSKDEWLKLSIELAKYGIDSTLHQYVDKKSSREFDGLHIEIKDINKAYSFSALLEVLSFFKNKSVNISFSKEFNIAMGCSLIQEYIKGERDKEEVKSQINKQLNSFYIKAQQSFLYSPSPFPRFLK